MKIIRLFLMALSLSAISLPGQASSEADKIAILHLMKAQFDRPDTPLDVPVIVSVDNHAVAGWFQAGRGGRALLRKRDGRWIIVLCAGEALRHSHGLAAAGLAPEEALQLAKNVEKEERPLSLEVRKAFDSFEGMVHVEQQGGHSQHHHPH